MVVILRQPVLAALSATFGTPKLDKAEAVTTYGRSRLGGAAIVGIGDSHTERTSAPLPESVGGIRLGGSSFFNQLCSRLGKLQYAQNSGIGGQTTTQMLARFETDVTAYNPRIVHILGGTNDTTNVGMPLATTVANLTTMIDRAHQIGAIALIGTIPPRNDTTLLAQIDKMNVAIKRLASKTGAHLIDYHSVLVSPTTGFYQAALQDDGIHTSALGAKKMAELAASVLDKVLPAYTLPFASSQHAATPNLLTNGMFIGDTNADGVADAWTLSGTATTSTASIVTDRTGWAQFSVSRSPGHLPAGSRPAWQLPSSASGTASRLRAASTSTSKQEPASSNSNCCSTDRPHCAACARCTAGAPTTPTGSSTSKVSSRR
ncbi:GDSL-type esterase/lipase family protein [Arthrobacter sp. AL12]|uniref:SGNH/GDSL hydrolase family protein n=1 Tax=Arthrobacter sp. AL12 TaxID=3042241 RepID=UPI00249CE810|nr:GDSL-type esterase/lipase family protein [Arthrobacter sp. AL12]MDI3213830.1 GDSL-type esterase/lipase family protein [Arthrobacter sp. AL12]